MIESVARALWEVVPYDRSFEWHNHPNPEVLDHYRARARKLLKQFDIKPKGIR